MFADVPRFHDAFLTGITLREARVDLEVREEAGAEYQVILEGVEELQIDDLRLGNIILWLHAFRGDLPNKEELSDFLERLFPSPHPDAAQTYHERHSKFLSEKVERVSSGEAALLVLTPAYGADLVAFCTAITVEGPA